MWGPRQALDILGEMDELGVEPDEDCFALAIDSCAESGRCEEALRLLGDMR